MSVWVKQHRIRIKLRIEIYYISDISAAGYARMQGNRLVCMHGFSSQALNKGTTFAHRSTTYGPD